MKRFGLTLAAVAIVGLLLFTLSGCATPEQQYVTQVEKSATRLTNKLLQYTQNDATLSAEEKDDWKKAIEAHMRLVRSGLEVD